MKKEKPNASKHLPHPAARTTGSAFAELDADLREAEQEDGKILEKIQNILRDARKSL